jgi:hypothetical protein
MKSAMLLKRCVVPRTLRTLRFLSTTDKPFSEKKAGEPILERSDQLRVNGKSTSDSNHKSNHSFGAEKSFAKASTKSQGEKIEGTNRASDTGFGTNDEFTSQQVMGDLRSSQTKKGNPLQTQRNFSTVGFMSNFKPLSASVRQLSDDLKSGMGKNSKKDEFDKKDDECSSCDDSNEQGKQKREKSSKKSLSSDSLARQEKWRTGNEDNKARDANAQKRGAALRGDL